MSYSPPFELTCAGYMATVLRPGKVLRSQLIERFGPRWQAMEHGVRDLIRMGLAESEKVESGEHYYSLTEEGRRKCPTRRQINSVGYCKAMADVATDEEMQETD